jgi:hypothetical protein
MLFRSNKFSLCRNKFANRINHRLRQQLKFSFVFFPASESSEKCKTQKPTITSHTMLSDANNAASNIVRFFRVQVEIPLCNLHVGCVRGSETCAFEYFKADLAGIIPGGRRHSLWWHSKFGRVHQKFNGTCIIERLKPTPHEKDSVSDFHTTCGCR